MASFIDTLLGNDDTGAEAARLQYQREQEAIAGAKAAGTQAQAGYEGISQAYNPWISGGGSALEQLLRGLGLSGTGGQEAFTNAYRGLPGYQSGLETGTTAALRGINASGHDLAGGRALKALQRYGSDYEDQRVGDYLSRLMGLNTQGLQAAGAKVGTQGAGIGANLGMQQSAYGNQFKSAATEPMGIIADRTAQNQAWTNLLGAGATGLGAWAGGGFKTPSFGSTKVG